MTFQVEGEALIALQLVALCKVGGELQNWELHPDEQLIACACPSERDDGRFKEAAFLNGKRSTDRLYGVEVATDCGSKLRWLQCSVTGVLPPHCPLSRDL